MGTLFGLIVCANQYQTLFEISEFQKICKTKDQPLSAKIDHPIKKNQGRNKGQRPMIFYILFPVFYVIF
jgi:hypothetical protein